MEKNTRTRKKGKIKKTISEWDAFWDDKKGYLAPSISWHDAIPEVLHIAIALQKHEPHEILAGLSVIRNCIKELNGFTWNGNLSYIIQLFRQHPKFISIVAKTELEESINYLIIVYKKIFNVNVPNGYTTAHQSVFRAYHEINGRRKDTSILCKYILCHFLNNRKPDPFGSFTTTIRSEIINPENSSRVTATWLIFIQNHKIIETSFSHFLWEHNIKELPFIAEPDSTIVKRESANFKKNKMNILKNKLDNQFLSFKKINLLNYFNKYVAEVFMGFVSRLHYLAIKIIEQEERHEGEIAESTLRLLYETHVKFLWLSKVQNIEHIKQYREYKVGREKLFLEHIEAMAKDNPNFAQKMDKLTSVFESYMQSEGVDDYKIAIERGDAFEKNLKEMADDLGEEESTRYFAIYKRTSDVVHANWRIIENYHLEKSLNPAQDNLLQYKQSQNTYAGLLPSYLGIILTISSLIKFMEFYETLFKKEKKTYNSLNKFYAEINKKFLEEFNTRKNN